MKDKNSKDTKRSYDLLKWQMMDYLDRNHKNTLDIDVIAKKHNQSALVEVVGEHPYYEMQGNMIIFNHRKKYQDLLLFFGKIELSGQYAIPYGYFSAIELLKLIDNLKECYLTNKNVYYRNSALTSLAKIQRYLSEIEVKSGSMKGTTSRSTVQISKSKSRKKR